MYDIHEIFENILNKVVSCLRRGLFPLKNINLNCKLESILWRKQMIKFCHIILLHKLLVQEKMKQSQKSESHSR